MKKPLLILIIPLLVSMAIVSTAYASPATLYVQPSSVLDITQVPGTSFTVNVNVKNVTDLYGFDFWLNYTTTVLTATEIRLGDLFPTGSWKVDEKINDLVGYIRYWVTMPLGTPRGGGVTGSGTLATINFTVQDYGESPLDLYNTLLSDSYGIYWDKEVYDGYFSNIPPPSRLYVDPESVVNPDLVPGNNFAINVNVFNATDLYGFDFWLNYTTTVLTATEIALGDFFPPDSFIWKQEINDTVGYVRCNVTMPLGTPPGQGVNGSGTLAIINFTVDSYGESLLDLCKTKIVDSEGKLIEPYIMDGYFNNKPIIHDIAITNIITTRLVTENNITYSHTLNEVYTGEKVNITVTVKNNGTRPETFSVTVYYDNTTIGTKNVTALSEGTLKTLTYEWNTEGVAVDYYTIWAEASVVAGETNTANNRFTKEGKFGVLEHTFPIELAVAAIVLVIVAAAIAVYFIKIRKPKP